MSTMYISFYNLALSDSTAKKVNKRRAVDNVGIATTKQKRGYVNVEIAFCSVLVFIISF